MIRANTSRPYSSVPKICASSVNRFFSEGVSKRACWFVAIALVSKSSITSAKTANRTNTVSTQSPRIAVRLLRNWRQIIWDLDFLRRASFFSVSFMRLPPRSQLFSRACPLPDIALLRGDQASNMQYPQTPSQGRTQMRKES